ncbi:MAG: MBL fold metallo-hydrolase [Bacteroidales bacterium]|nr:MBL fold metallo-hydrolase [Bacteroidales bacterium]
MDVKVFQFNPFQQNTLLVWDETKEAVIIDAGMLFKQEKQQIKQFIEDNQLKLVRVLNTHLHLDHQFGNKFLFDTYGIMPEVGKDDEFLLDSMPFIIQKWGLPYSDVSQPIGNYITDNQEIKFGNTTFVALHTPGHSPGSYSFYCKEAGIVFVGDVLFKGSIGRTDLEKGDHVTLIRSIKNRLFTLPDETIVYNGHGPTTTIGEEKQFNPFL